MPDRDALHVRLADDSALHVYHYAAYEITALRRLPGGDRFRIFGGMNGMFFFEELSRGAVGIMTGVAVPDVLVRIYDLFRAGDVAGAAATYDRYASYIRY